MCYACSTCPEGQVAVGGCIADQDTICAPPSDFVGYVSTGKAGEDDDYPMGCTCDDKEVGRAFPSRSGWFFNFRDAQDMPVFSTQSFATPCLNATCPVDMPFDEPPGFSKGFDPKSVSITTDGNDAWCMSRICVASASLGKRWVWKGMQWMNPGSGRGNASAMPVDYQCANVPWADAQLVEEDVGDCFAGVTVNINQSHWKAVPTPAPTEKPENMTAVTNALAAIQANASNSTASNDGAGGDETDAGCTTCADLGNGFYTVGCGVCKDDEGNTPRRFVKSATTASACKAACEDSTDCDAYEAEDTGRCHLYYNSGSPDGADWSEDASGNSKLVTATSASGGFASGCNKRGAAPANCGQEAQAQAQAGDSACTAGKAIPGGFTVLGCGFCASPLGGVQPRRFYADDMLPSDCREACSLSSDCYAYEVAEDAGKRCYLYIMTGSAGADWTEENGGSGNQVTSVNGEGYPTGCITKDSAPTAATAAPAQAASATTPAPATPAPSIAAPASSTATTTPAPTATPTTAPTASTCTAGQQNAAFARFTTVGCGRCKDQSGNDPRRFFKVGVSVNECYSACDSNQECNAFEAEETGDKKCFAYFETGSPGMDWTEESASNIAKVAKAEGNGFPAGCNYRPPVNSTEALVAEIAEAEVQELLLG